MHVLKIRAQYITTSQKKLYYIKCLIKSYTVSIHVQEDSFHTFKHTKIQVTSNSYTRKELPEPLGNLILLA